MAKKRGATYSREEVSTMLDIIADILPIGRMEWETVTTEHNAAWPTTTRDTSSLQRKFNDLAKSTMPTGDPNIPPHVLEAKRIRMELKKKAEIDDDASEDDSEDDILESENDPIQPNATEANSSDTDAASVSTNVNPRVSPSLRRVSTE